MRKDTINIIFEAIMHMRRQIARKGIQKEVKKKLMNTTGKENTKGIKKSLNNGNPPLIF